MPIIVPRITYILTKLVTKAFKLLISKNLAKIKEKYPMKKVNKIQIY